VLSFVFSTPEQACDRRRPHFQRRISLQGQAVATLKSSQHFGERQTTEKMNNLFSVFDPNDGASNTMATSLFYDLHGNPLLRGWRQPSMLRLSIVRCQIRGLAILLRSSEELDDVREADDAGGRMADERLHQTLLRSY
jgi:hypothetical protein